MKSKSVSQIKMKNKTNKKKQIPATKLYLHVTNDTSIKRETISWIANFLHREIAGKRV